ncbi:MAG: RluA family pseudouridine synthase [Magnetococcus sp. MYC-9]
MNVKISLSHPKEWHADSASAGEKSSSVRHVYVSEAEAGTRVDRFLGAQLPGLPHAFIQRLLRTGQVRVNSGRVQGQARLAVGDDVRLPPVRLEQPKTPLLPPDGLVRALRGRVLWRDEALLVLNKTAGVAVHGGSGNRWGVVDGMRRLLQEEDSGLQPELCHRLDKDTSGCLLFALTPVALRQMADAFRTGSVEKEYLALVRGHPQPEEGLIDRPLTRGIVRSGERIVVSAERGLPARTRYRVLRRFDRASLVQIHLESGRTHQIRVHFQAIGHPLAGDRKYGDHAFNLHMERLGLHRLFLHARQIRFAHPLNGVETTIEAPLEEALQRTLLQAESTMPTRPSS